MDGRRARVVIVGAGFGGLRTALRLAAQGAHDVVLVDKQSLHVYTPWLYEVASGRTDGATPGISRRLRHSAGIPLARILARHGVELRIATVKNVDTVHRHVVFADGMTLGYDALVLAVGSEMAYFGIPGLAEHTIPLKSIEDAVRIHASVSAALAKAEHRDVHIVVGGAGPSGVELIGELATMVRSREHRGTLPRHRVHCTLVDAGARVLGMCRPSVSRIAERRLAALGVRIRLETLVTKATATHVHVAPKPGTAHAGEPTVTLPADCAVWCGGVAPSAFTQALALPKDARGRIRTDARGEVFGETNVFALGDASVREGEGVVALPQTAQAVDAYADTVARNVHAALARRALRAYVPPATWPFVLTVGGRYGVADVYGLVVHGWPAYALRRGADLRYLLRILPPLHAYRVWRSRITLYAENDEA